MHMHNNNWVTLDKEHSWKRTIQTEGEEREKGERKRGMGGRFAAMMGSKTEI